VTQVRRKGCLWPYHVEREVNLHQSSTGGRTNWEGGELVVAEEKDTQLTHLLRGKS